LGKAKGRSVSPSRENKKVAKQETLNLSKKITSIGESLGRAQVNGGGGGSTHWLDLYCKEGRTQRGEIRTLSRAEILVQRDTKPLEAGGEEKATILEDKIVFYDINGVELGRVKGGRTREAKVGYSKPLDSVQGKGPLDCVGEEVPVNCSATTDMEGEGGVKMGQWCWTWTSKRRLRRHTWLGGRAAAPRAVEEVKCRGAF